MVTENQRPPPRARRRARPEQPRVLFPGRLRSARRGSRPDHDPRLPVWNGRLRGHPGLLERGREAAVRAPSQGAHRPAAQLQQDHADGGGAVGRGVHRDRPAGPAPQRVPGKTPTAVRRSTRAPRRSASSSTG